MDGVSCETCIATATILCEVYMQKARESSFCLVSINTDGTALYSLGYSGQPFSHGVLVVCGT